MIRLGVVALWPLQAACSEDRSAPDDVRLVTAPPPWTQVPPVPPVRTVCTPALPEVSAPSDDAPRIELLGDAIVEHPLGQPYEDAGVRASSLPEGDLSAHVEVSGLDGIDVWRVADYWIRYRVASASDPSETAVETDRLVRITDGKHFARQSSRPLGATRSPLGYFEHLPEAYTQSSPERTAGSGEATPPDEFPGFPLLVYNHGVGEAYDWIDQDDDEFGRSEQKLDRLLRRGLPALLATGTWDDTLPFVVLSPQRCLLATEAEVKSMHAFVEYALSTYRVDPARIYFVGFSAGSYITWEYTLRHSEELAAVVHLAGGDSELARCPRSQPPTWAFHAKNDPTVPLAEDRRTIEFINSCSPRERAKLTILHRGGHLIDGAVLDGTAMTPTAFDPDSDPYDRDLYAWLLQYSR